jgi:transposase InsO family protein
VSERTAAKWLARYRIEWRDGLRDRSSAPRRIPRRTSAERVRAIELLRARLGLRHTRTRPRRPRTNGKAERFIQTVLNEWAYARLYADSEERARALSLWLNHYNYRRPHGSLGHQPPSSRLNNVSRNYT